MATYQIEWKTSALRELKRLDKPVIRGTRLTVDYILNCLTHGGTEAEFLAEYNGLTKEDIQACLLFATKTLKDIDFLPLAS